MNSVLKKDIEDINNSNIIDWGKINNKSIFITGSTGLIGSIIVKALLYRNKNFNSNIKLHLLIRNKDKAIKKFGDTNDITYYEESIENFYKENLKIDYIIHCASPTKSKFFIENPVETIDTAVIGTKRILECARNWNVKSMVYLSSMEMYGTLDKEDVYETDQGYIDTLNVRSSYSLGKRMCELYCYSYMKEYNVPVKIGRIAQTFGAGISKEENRVYKSFADSVINGKDIVLKSSGTTIINFSYTTDTVLGILCILLNGKNGEAYNIVGDKTNMTILDSAKWLAHEIGKDKINVIIDIPKENTGFAPDNKMILNNEKIKKIGWYPSNNIKDGYKKLIDYLIEGDYDEV